MRTIPGKRDSTKYCEFHRDHGHQTDNCIQLRKEIEYLIRCGLSHPDSRSDLIGGSEPVLGRETIYWDSLPIFYLFIFFIT